jgi:hypothetical protein
MGTAEGPLKDLLPATLAHELHDPRAVILTALHALRYGRGDEVAARQARGRAERQTCCVVSATWSSRGTA